MFAAGASHSLVILEDGQLWCSGSNVHGQLGSGSAAKISSFARVDLGERKAIAVAAGYYNSFVILEDGQLWGSGQNSSGQLGLGNTTDLKCFARVDLGERKAIAVAAGADHSLVILEDGQLLSSGSNKYGQLGSGITTELNSFARVDLGERKAIAVAAGHYNSLVILEDGQLWGSGQNDDGQLGLGDTRNRNSFAMVDLGERRVIAVSAGGSHSLVVLEDGQVWSSGQNRGGQLGSGNTTKLNSFARVDLGERKAIAVAAGGSHSLVVLEDGQLWSSGSNVQGQLGSGNTTKTNSFARVDLGEREAIAVAAGHYYSLAILEDGQLWGSGSNGCGQLGLGDATVMNSFAMVDLGERKAISRISRVIWMWADSQPCSGCCSHFQSLYWSSDKNPTATKSELSKYTGKYAGRPVKMVLWRNDRKSEVVCDSVRAAIRQLEP